MRRIFLITIILIFGIYTAKSQFSDIGKQETTEWTYNYKKISDNKIKVMIKVRIKDGWHLYSQNFEDGGPMRLYIDFEGKDIKKVNKTIERPEPKTEFDEIFDIDVKYFEKYATFMQEIEINKTTKKIKIIIQGQACRTGDGICVMVKDEYVIEIGNN